VALDSYTNLKTAIGNLLNRTDLTSYIPDFITLAESELKRKLRRTEARAQYTINDTTWTIPSEIDRILSIRLVTGSPSLDKPIPVVSTAEADTHRARLADVDGRPQKANIVGRKVVFTPSPDTSYTIEVTYIESLTVLSDSNSSNVVLQDAPDLYLYGAAKHSAPFLGDDARIALWQQLYDAALGEYNTKREDEKYSANPKHSLPSRTFG
jgi:hypothetical protein